ncbi:LysR family transcriptional regulator [Microbispora triticiradicis]|uniref:LysR family transcriptional regulator n=2 Tax=Microbispora TaxID=2005 RepID=A0ABY3LUR7_9ACTN|nr:MULTISPECIES: LysR family transcriptional regulator [Microbispora]TLP61968.1 LysR family transcriptional regulator [Microbispora fusca]TYB56060.1 LysR family transcriptional regulator [Microbispora tritici]
MTIDVVRLRVLVALARAGTVTAAARELHYSQPSVSHHLARLEAETGAKLVQRVGRGVRLTEAGRLLAERGAEILGRLDAASAELSAHVGLRAGRVRLAAFPSALGTFVPAAAQRLAREHPGLDLRLMEAEPPEALRLLRAGEVDVAVVFRYGGTGPEDDGVRLVHLLDDPSLLVTPLGAASGSDLAAYADAPWIAGCERCRAHLLALCGEAGFEPRVSFTTDDYVAVQAMVAAGLGVAVLPRLALSAHRHPDVLTSDLPGPARRVHAATYGEPPDPPATAALVAALLRAQLGAGDGAGDGVGPSLSSSVALQTAVPVPGS